MGVLSLAGLGGTGWRRSAVLAVHGDPQDRGPHAVVVGRLLGSSEELFKGGLQLVEVPLVEADHGAAKPNVAVLPDLLGVGGGVDVSPGRLQRGAEKQGNVGGGGDPVGGLNAGRAVDAFDLAARERPVLGDLDEVALFELAEVVVEAVGAHADVLGELLGRLGASDEQLVEADA
jgi:hypothetical protein